MSAVFRQEIHPAADNADRWTKFHKNSHEKN